MYIYILKKTTKFSITMMKLKQDWVQYIPHEEEYRRKKKQETEKIKKNEIKRT
jgi:hypothetical protein